MIGNSSISLGLRLEIKFQELIQMVMILKAQHLEVKLHINLLPELLKDLELLK
tara:strand:- start:991 stop:1149 length:159 start_codon:yes stop_codon:yes gene_type:complete